MHFYLHFCWKFKGNKYDDDMMIHCDSIQYSLFLIKLQLIL